MSIPGKLPSNLVDWLRVGYRQLGRVRYGMVLVCAAAQAATIAITWPLWQVREHPPHLPWIDLPQMPFGWLLLLSLAAMLVRPRVGLLAHASVLLASFVFDQFRTQPQVIAVAVLMLPAVEPRATPLGRWFLASLWLWAGLHKFLSPDWFGLVSFQLVDSLGLDARQFHGAFAVVVALSETLLGLLAIVRPRWAAWPCVVLHLGIAVFLSPWIYDANASVIPWNVCTAVLGWWLLRNSSRLLPQTVTEAAVAAVLLVLPAGFYVGWLDARIAGVLYSDNLPRGVISSNETATSIDGWGDLRVPFPYERRLLRLHFQRVASPGFKLHIADPRPWLSDLYFLKHADGSVKRISRTRFLDAADGEVAGVEHDSRSSMFALSQAGARMLKRTPTCMVYAVQIPPEGYDAKLLSHLRGLPNLEQLQLAGCAVDDAGLRQLRDMRNLQGIGLSRTNVTDAALRHLATFPKLTYIEHADTAITDAALRRYGFSGTDDHE